MTTNRKEILDLLAQGKITADEAAEMLSAPNEAPAMPEPPEPAVAPFKEKAPAETAVSGKAPTWFRVRVRNLETGQNRVSVNIPVRMLKFGMKIGKQFTSELDELNWDEINGMINDMQSGMLVEVQDEESNEHVQVFLE